MDILNIGAGNKPLDGAVNHDRVKHRPEIDVEWDLNNVPWPWEDNSFDLVVAKAVFEHLELTLLESMAECWRILRPGGEVYVKLPYWDSDGSYVDPTHRWRFSLRSLDVFDLDTVFGQKYRFYTDKKWKIVKPARLNDAGTSFAAKLKVVK